MSDNRSDEYRERSDERAANAEENRKIAERESIGNTTMPFYFGQASQAELSAAAWAIAAELARANELANERKRYRQAAIDGGPS